MHVQDAGSDLSVNEPHIGSFGFSHASNQLTVSTSEQWAQFEMTKASNSQNVNDSTWALPEVNSTSEELEKKNTTNLKEEIEPEIISSTSSSFEQCAPTNIEKSGGQQIQASKINTCFGCSKTIKVIIESYGLLLENANIMSQLIV